MFCILVYFLFHHCACVEGGDFMDEMINEGEIQTARPTLDFSRRSLLKSRGPRGGADR